MHNSPAIIDFLNGKKQIQCTGSLSLYWHSCRSSCHLAPIPVCREAKSRCVYWLVLLIIAVPEWFLVGCCVALTEQFAGCSGQAAGCTSLCMKPRTGKPNSIRKRTNQEIRKIKSDKTTEKGFKSGCWLLSPRMTSITIIKGIANFFRLVSKSIIHRNSCWQLWMPGQSSVVCISQLNAANQGQEQLQIALGKDLGKLKEARGRACR